MRRATLGGFALALTLSGLLSATVLAADEAGFVSLFDGKTLEGWAGKPQFWSVKDGAITGQTTADNPTKGNTFLIWRGGKVADFELRLKFRMVGGNSGIQYRSEDKGDFVVGGYQADMDAGMHFIGILYEERGRGILAKRGQKLVVSEDGKKSVAAEKTCDEKEFLAHQERRSGTSSRSSPRAATWCRRSTASRPST